MKILLSLILVILTLGDTYTVSQNVIEEVPYWTENAGRDASTLKVFV